LKEIGTPSPLRLDLRISSNAVQRLVLTRRGEKKEEAEKKGNLEAKASTKKPRSKGSVTGEKKKRKRSTVLVSPLDPAKVRRSRHPGKERGGVVLATSKK